MQSITLDFVRKLDSSSKIQKFLQGVQRETANHEDNRSCIRTLAEDLKIEVNKLSSYIWLQIYLEEITNSYDDAPDIAVVAQQFGIDLDELRNYIEEKEFRFQDKEILTFMGSSNLLQDLMLDGGKIIDGDF